MVPRTAKKSRRQGANEADRFVRLNHPFWTQRWDQKLSLPALAMLLVALHSKPNFTLATEHVPDWYGWSADTAERGFHELDTHGLLKIRKRIYTDPISPTGVSSKNVYTLLAPFDAATVDRHATAAAKARR